MTFSSQSTTTLLPTTTSTNKSNSYDADNNDTDIPTTMSSLSSIYLSTTQASRLHNTIAAIIFSLISIFVLVSNCTVIVGISQRRIWRRRSLRFFILLVVTDLLVALLTLPIHVVIYAAPSLLSDASLASSSESGLLSLT